MLLQRLLSWFTFDLLGCLELSLLFSTKPYSEKCYQPSKYFPLRESRLPAASGRRHVSSIYAILDRELSTV